MSDQWILCLKKAVSEDELVSVAYREGVIPVTERIMHLVTGDVFSPSLTIDEKQAKALQYQGMIRCLCDRLSLESDSGAV